MSTEKQSGKEVSRDMSGPGAGAIRGDARPAGEIIAQLAQIVDERRTAAAETSYTAKLLAAGPLKCAKKLGEEGVECALAVSAEGQDAVVAEAADVVYHLLVALAVRDVPLAAVEAELERRFELSGLEEKALRTES